MNLSMPLTFAPNSSDGAEICASVTIIFDAIPEDSEGFTVVLDLLTMSNSLMLGNSITVVNITDLICKQISTCRTILSLSPSHPPPLSLYLSFSCDI